MKPKFPKKCANKRCHGIVVSAACRTPLCPKCKWRQWVDRNPLRAAFKTLRNHAKERGKPFTMSFEYFRALAVQTEYMARKGKTSLSLHVDRIREELGYTEANCQVITLAENNRKRYVPYFQQYVESIKMDIANGIL